MEQMQLMMKDHQMMKDPEVRGDMDDMQAHTGTMSKDMARCFRRWRECRSVWALPFRNPRSRRPGAVDVDREVRSTTRVPLGKPR